MNINDLKPLTTDQYDKCREAALERVQTRIGSKPQRKDFERELGALWGVLDILALIVFVAAFIISSLHIQDYVLAAVTGKGDTTYTFINQWGYIALAESSMVLFMVLHGLTAKQRRAREWYLRPLSIHLMLAVVAGVFIFTANLSSGIGILLSIMPPLFTTGIAFNMERLIIASITRRNEVDTRYLSSLKDFEAASKDPEQHSLFPSFFKQELWSKLISLKPNAGFKDSPAGFKAAAVAREMERDQWVNATPDATIEVTPTEIKEVKPLPPNPFGSIAHEPEESEFIQTIESVSVNGFAPNGNHNGKV